MVLWTFLLEKNIVVYYNINDGWIYPTFRKNDSKDISWIPFEKANNKSMCDFIRLIHKNLINKFK